MNNIVVGIRYYCTGCGWSYVDNLVAAATTSCQKCWGASFSTEKPRNAQEAVRVAWFWIGVVVGWFLALVRLAWWQAMGQ